MEQPKSTPEEQLLKLIENPGADPKAGATALKDAKPAKKGFSLAGFFKGKKSGENKETSKGSVAVVERNPFAYVKGVNVFLILGVVVCGTYLALDVSVLKGDPKNYLSQVSLNDSIFPFRDDSQNEKSRHELKYYHDLIDRRNPFSLMTGKPEAKVEAKPQTLSVSKPKSDKMEKLMQSIKLVGISWSDGTPLAMIEETEGGKTYFLRQGQEINGLKVQTVNKEKVVVTYEGEEASLF